MTEKRKSSCMPGICRRSTLLKRSLMPTWCCVFCETVQAFKSVTISSAWAEQSPSFTLDTRGNMIALGASLRGAVLPVRRRLPITPRGVLPLHVSEVSSASWPREVSFSTLISAGWGMSLFMPEQASGKATLEATELVRILGHLTDTPQGWRVRITCPGGEKIYLHLQLQCECESQSAIQQRM
jgi:hypothetical protein